MPIEIRELIIRVKVEEPLKKHKFPEGMDVAMIKRTIAATCKKEVKAQLDKIKER